MYDERERPLHRGPGREVLIALLLLAVAAVTFNPRVLDRISSAVVSNTRPQQATESAARPPRLPATRQTLAEIPVLQSAWQTFADSKGSSVSVAVSSDASARDGKTILTLKYNLEPGGWAGAFSAVPSMAAPPTDLELWLRGQKSSNRLWLEVSDANDERFVYEFEDDSDSWKAVRVPLSSLRSRTDWQPPAAKVNRSFDFPATTFTVAPCSGVPASGSLCLSGIRFVYTP